MARLEKQIASYTSTEDEKGSGELIARDIRGDAIEKLHHSKMFLQQKNVIKKIIVLNKI